MEKMERSLKECEQRSLKDKNEWEAREQRYKEKVRELSKQPNGVPMSLFKLIKDESETRKLEIQKLRKKSSELESTLLQWDTQAKASMSKMRSEADRAAAISQRVHQEKASLLQSKKSSSLTKPNTLASYHPAKKQLAVQTHSPRELNGPVSNPTRVPPTDPPLREHINWVFSGAQVTPKGSKKINVATIPIRGEPGSVALRSSERAAKVSSKIGAKVHEKATGSMNCQATSQMEATKHPVSVRSDKENQGNKVTFSFPTPDEKNGQTGQNLRLKMVREAGGRKGLLEKLEKMRSPRSSMCSLDEKATQ